MKNPRLTAALRYADEQGWSVFPLSGKRPMHGSRAYQDATSDTKQIRRWWKDAPDANVGIACSSENGPIVLDVDGPSGFELIDSLYLPSTREASSRSDRLHLYFQPTLEGVAVPRKIKVRKNGKKYELDILGDGGYVVAPPSIHPDTGEPYQWLNRRPLVPLPSSVLSLLEAGESEAKRTSAPPLPDEIGNGERDQLLASLAGTMRRRGASEDAILAALREENATRVNPPLPDKDLRRIAKSIARYEPAQKMEHMTDLGNARRFINMFGENLKAIGTRRRPWMLWEGTRWEPDTTGETDRMAKTVVRTMYTDASKIEDPEQRETFLKHVSKSEQAPRLKAMLEVAATEPEVATTGESFDAHPWLLNVENGTVDLKTGELKNHDREHLITMQAPVEYDEDACAPRWERFLMEIMDGDVELVEFLQRAVGYSLTGDSREQCLFFCYGQGSNGKSTMFEILRELFGSYAQQTDFNTFLSRRGDGGPRNDLARMRGARLITASEADSERGFDATVLKQLTGGDTIVARKLYEEFFEFRPEHKLWLAANHKPIVREQTVAFWRRIRLIPFTVTFERRVMGRKRENQLPKQLRKEMPGILNWAIEGCLRWRKQGLLEPEAVKKATQSYREENDVLGEFLTQRCVLHPKEWSSISELYKLFGEWWADTRGPRSTPLSLIWFTRMLSERSELKSVKKDNVRGYRGVGIRTTMGA